jgi:hypothetical protein
MTGLGGSKTELGGSRTGLGGSRAELRWCMFELEGLEQRHPTP